MDEVISEVNTKKKKVPTQLKQLAEKRARIAGQLYPLQAAQPELKALVESLSAQLKEAIRNYDSASEKVALLTVELRQCDETITRHYPTINPDRIDPIKGSNRYSSHGSLREYLLTQIKLRSPDWVSSVELGKLAVDAFSLPFATRLTRKQWNNRSLHGALRFLLNEGLIEKGPKIPNPGKVPTNTWRIKLEAQPRLSDL